MDDEKLLREYVHTGSQSAFRILVNRHIGLVYSAAQRMVHDSQLAEGITQSVFATLARKADVINPSEVLARWLHDTTRRQAVHVSLTADQQRGGGQATTSVSTPGHELGAGRVVDALEAMMDKLPPPDREAIVLHYLEKRSLEDVAGILRLSEEAARAHVSHAVEQLHRGFNENGVPIASAVLATVLSSECAMHVPIGLSLAVSTEALEAAATVASQHSPQRWWDGRTAALAFITVLLAGMGIFFLQYARVNRLKSENDRLVAERDKLKAENAVGRSSVARDGNIELVRLRRSDDELRRLRREVAQLRQQSEAATRPVSPPETPPPALTPAEPHEPGRFISSGELRFTGYSTPEAAMESIVWGMVAGSYDAFLTALSPEDRADELDLPEGREFFEARQQQLASQFKGMQVSALKVVSDDEVELKVLLDFGSQLFYIQPLVRINEQWLLSNSTRDYDSDWDNDGEIQQFTTPR
jgi:RNA polymerase sigma factor (sigma-70 family)